VEYVLWGKKLGQEGVLLLAVSVCVLCSSACVQQAGHCMDIESHTYNGMYYYEAERTLWGDDANQNARSR
jgi:hypothetical protein